MYSTCTKVCFCFLKKGFLTHKKSWILFPYFKALWKNSNKVCLQVRLSFPFLTCYEYHFEIIFRVILSTWMKVVLLFSKVMNFNVSLSLAFQEKAFFILAQELSQWFPFNYFFRVIRVDIKLCLICKAIQYTVNHIM